METYNKKLSTIKTILGEMSARLSKLNTKTTNISLVLENGNLEQLDGLPEEYESDLHSFDKMFATINKFADEKLRTQIKELEVIHKRMLQKVMNLKINIALQDKVGLKVVAKEYNNDINKFKEIIKRIGV